MIRFFFVASLFLLIFGCNSSFYTVTASLETDAVQSADDAADDPAIFVHPSNPDLHAMIGTDKQRGLVVFDTKGKIKHDYPFGSINNVDLRQNFPFNGSNITLVGGSNRSNNTIVLYSYQAETFELEPIPCDTIRSLTDEVYGFCFAASSNAIYAFVVGKNGVVEQWGITEQNNRLHAELVRSIDIGEQCEGMVADDELGFLYVAEETKGIWKLPIDPTNKTIVPELIADLKTNRALKADLEGLAIYYAPQGNGYLIASSQGNYSYAVFERSVPHTYLGSFKVKAGVVDGSEETDGLDVTHLPFGAACPNGCLVVQDGKNKDSNNQLENQNFKFIAWEQIAKVFQPNLLGSKPVEK
ncbi:MAG: phytase [Saprospiraceae bacterium]|nr:phytase [Saprospiraceae bacterium]